jgi:hypothetical protein
MRESTVLGGLVLLGLGWLGPACSSGDGYSSDEDTSGPESPEVELDVASESDSSFFTQGFQVELFDANLRRVSRAPLVAAGSSVIVARFQVVEFFQGPFVAVLVPPLGVSLKSAVTVSVDVRQRVSARATISVTSVTRLSGAERAGTLDVRTESQDSGTRPWEPAQRDAGRRPAIVDTSIPRPRPPQPHLRVKDDPQ